MRRGNSLVELEAHRELVRQRPEFGSARPGRIIGDNRLVVCWSLQVPHGLADDGREHRIPRPLVQRCQDLSGRPCPRVGLGRNYA